MILKYVSWRSNWEWRSISTNMVILNWSELCITIVDSLKSMNSYKNNTLWWINGFLMRQKIVKMHLCCGLVCHKTWCFWQNWVSACWVLFASFHLKCRKSFYKHVFILEKQDILIIKRYNKVLYSCIKNPTEQIHITSFELNVFSKHFPFFIV